MLGRAIDMRRIVVSALLVGALVAARGDAQPAPSPSCDQLPVVIKVLENLRQTRDVYEIQIGQLQIELAKVRAELHASKSEGKK